MSDVWSALQKRVRTSGAAPLVTYVDLATTERTELSATSLANAAAKIANALRDEFELETGARVCLDLPLHWQRSVWCAGVWTAGCLVTTGLQPADLVVTTAPRADVALSAGSPTVSVSLHPFGLPVTEALPPGVEDVTLAVRQQPDAYLFDPPSGQDLALATGDDLLTQTKALASARDLGERCGLQHGGRLLATAGEGAGPEDWLACLAVPLACEASVVLVTGASDEPGALASLRAQEHITAELRLSR